MSNSVLPTLPGATLNVLRSVLAPPVKVLTTPSRREYRARDATLPLYAYRLEYEFLRADAAWLELQTLVGFYNQMGGAFDTFLFTDPVDNSITNQTIGTGDGTTVNFQLVRTMGGFVEAVYDVNGTPSIYINGVKQTSGYSIGSTGVVTFTAAPAAGAVVSWTGSFYRRVRFRDDNLDSTQFMQFLWETKTVNLLHVRL